MSNNNDNSFGKRPETVSRLKGLRDQGFVMCVTKAFGPNGEDLILRDGPVFSGEPGVTLHVKQGELEADVVLSPFYGDPSKQCEVEFEEGKPCELSVVENGAPLDEIPGMSTEDGGRYFAIYLTDKLDKGELIAINNVWGNTASQFLSEGEMLRQIAEAELAEGEAG